MHSASSPGLVRVSTIFVTRVKRTVEWDDEALPLPAGYPSPQACRSGKTWALIDG